MNPETASRLLDLNRQFYQTFSHPFSTTRQRLQPGVQRILEGLDLSADILDLGCGNGRLAQELARRGYRGKYIGLDNSAKLLAQARQMTSAMANVDFLYADLSNTDWDAVLQEAEFDAALAFAVLHHLPASWIRQQVLEKLHRLLRLGGRFIHSEWQFLHSPRLRARVQPWESIGLSSGEVDPGDYLLDWRHGGYGLRYVHHFSEDELARLAESTGFNVIETFHSDGAGGRLGLYQIWQKNL